MSSPAPERARGGVGLSILEATAVHPSSVLGLIGYDDRVISMYAKLMDTIRPLGMRVFQQLWPGGHVYPPPGGLPMRGASALPGPVTGLPAVPIGTQEVGDFVAAFAAAARRSAEGGIDGIEVAASHGYLMHQFLSPLTNTRQDRYGGSLENRMRFLAEVLAAIRAAVGPDLPVGVRMGAGQIAGDLDEPTVAEVARRLAERGLIDFLNASMGDYYAMHWMMGGMDRPAGYMLPSSGRITRAVTAVPRIVTGRRRPARQSHGPLAGGCGRRHGARRPGRAGHLQGGAQPARRGPGRARTRRPPGRRCAGRPGPPGRHPRGQRCGPRDRLR